MANYDTLFPPFGEYDDLTMGKVLGHSAIYVDCRDVNLEERFFPLPIDLLLEKTFDKDIDWFLEYNYYNYTQGSLRCCSDVPIAFHYIEPPELYTMEYLVYHVHPFGVYKNISETLPRKLGLAEIIAASDVKSTALNFMNHIDFHRLTSSEIF